MHMLIYFRVWVAINSSICNSYPRKSSIVTSAPLKFTTFILFIISKLWEKMCSSGKVVYSSSSSPSLVLSPKMLFLGFVICILIHAKLGKSMCDNSLWNNGWTKNPIYNHRNWISLQKWLICLKCMPLYTVFSLIFAMDSVHQYMRLQFPLVVWTLELQWDSVMSFFVACQFVVQVNIRWWGKAANVWLMIAKVYSLAHCPVYVL